MKYICDSCEKYPCDDTEIKLMKYCPAYSPKPKPPTNADRIRSMTDEELATILWSFDTMYGKTREEHLEWLKQEAT